MTGVQTCALPIYIISLVPELEDAFDIEIKPKELKAENFNNVDLMMAMIERLQDQ